MADLQDSIRREPPLSRRGDHHTTSYTGSRAQLLEAGIIGPDDPLPGDPGRRKKYFRYPEGATRRILAVWKRQHGRFTVMVLRPQDEIDANDRLLAYQTMMAMAGQRPDIPAGRTAGAHLRLVWSDGRIVWGRHD